MLKTQIISLGLYSDSGGPTKTIGAFAEALDAPVCCFCDARRLRKDRVALEKASVLSGSRLPGLAPFCHPKRVALQALEAEARQADLLSCHSFYRFHNLWTRRFSRREGIPYWFVPHGILDPYVLSYGRFYKRAFLRMGGRAFIDDAACLVFSTRREWEKAEAVFGPLPGEVLPWPVAPVDCSGREAGRARVRKRLGIPADAPVLLYFGRIHPMKRPLETIRAVAALEREDLHLLMVGPFAGVSETECREAAREAGLRHLHLTGPVFGAEKYDCLFASDLYLSFSFRENFNHTAAESMAAGLPVILSAGNDLGPEASAAGGGWHLEDDRFETYVAAIEAALALEPVQRSAKGRHGQAFVERTCSERQFRLDLRRLAEKYAKS